MDDKDAEFLITPEVIEKMKSRDDRIAAVDLMLKIEHELKHSIALQLVLDKASEEAASALESLAEADPTDANQIIRLQAKVYRARLLARTINAARVRGDVAERSLREESEMQIEDSDEQN